MANTLRLLMPQWQGGNNPSYILGAKMLSWLAPSNNNCIEIEVPIEPYNGNELPVENGVLAQSILLRQLESAASIIKSNKPSRIIVFGGDCLVSQAPFAYLNELYNGELGVLWLDAHPDVSTPKTFIHEHAMVLGNLLGEGDPYFSATVDRPINPKMVMYGGLQRPSAKDKAVIDRLNIRRCSPKELIDNSNPVISWIEENNIKYLAIHLDLDVLDPKLFRSLLFSNPNGEVIDAPSGELTLDNVSRIIGDAAQKTDIVGFVMAEHLPWDAINLKSFMQSVDIFNK